MKLVKVTWYDITVLEHWTNEDEIDKTMCDICITVGWLYWQDDEVIKVIVTKKEHEDGEEDYDYVYIIPKGAVIKIEEL